MRAASFLADRELAHPILLGPVGEIRAVAGEHDIPLAGVGNLGLNDSEVLGDGNPLGAADEMHLAGDGHGRFLRLEPR